MQRLIPIVGIAGLVAACASPSARIASGLERYGFDPARSVCIGDRLERNLSLGQLQQLGRAAAAYGRDDPDPRRLSADDLLRVSGEIKDPKVALEVGKALAGCTVSA